MSSVKARVTSLVATWSMKARQARSFSAPAGESMPMRLAEPAATHNHAAAASACSSPSTPPSIADLTDGQLVHLLRSGLLSSYRLEADLRDATRAVAVRRAFVADALARAPAAQRVVSPAGAAAALASLPSSSAAFDTDAFYRNILNTNCEAVIGYVPLPVGVVGPLLLDGKSFFVPMATTEGALIASTNRGCAAIRRAGGADTALLGDGMTRAPLVRVSGLAEAAALRAWIEQPANFAAVAAAFDGTTRFGRLTSVTAATAGRNVYLRFKARTGDAMGMNMITKGVSAALALLETRFPGMRVLSLSGNMCTDKKPSAINWVQGRGKSVSAEVRLSGHVLRTVLKTTADALVDLNTAKNLVGSALAGSVGGFNAHAANIVSAVFLATGQDPAQNVESSTCLTLIEKDDGIADAADPGGAAGPGVVMSVTMPSVEVGTVGGGTSLGAQGACLELLGLRGSHATSPGANAQALARVVAGAVLAGELSLMSALTSNDLLNAHIKLNRKAAPAAGGGVAPAPAASSSHGSSSSSGGLAVSVAMLAKLRELAGIGGEGKPPAAATPAAHHHAAAAHPLSPAGHVPGGAPAGAHSHPLHLAGAPAASSSPGRRYFAAPTTSRGARFGAGGAAGGSWSATAETASAAFAAGGASFFAAAAAPSQAYTSGVDEESRGMHRQQQPHTAAAAAKHLVQTQAAGSGKLFDKILIANRGEISCRVSRTAHRLGIKTVAIYSDPDIGGIHVKAADEAVCVGPARSTLSYLSIPRVVDAIERTGAQAVHPGYGFLSENSLFVAELEKRGIVFIGPKATAMEALGDKIHSKQLAISAGVNTIPGHLSDIPNAEEAVRIARDIGYPVMVKASSGGGGKGMRCCYTDDEVRVGYRLSKQEAKSAFASDVVFIEKFIEQPRHIEIQLIADNHGNVKALTERECTIQRRNQKVIEESPSVFLDPSTRAAMQEQAASLARSVGYNSAGTCEFLVDKYKKFFFLEMNTRLQVEHPVTEAVTGVDLVELMIRSAAGERLPALLLGSGPMPILGHAFESRVYAEDPLRGFLPSTGVLTGYVEPHKFGAEGRDPYLDPDATEPVPVPATATAPAYVYSPPSIRADAGVAHGSEISMFYDPMICKLITHGATRASALDRMRACLDAYVLRGVGHNIGFLRDLCAHPRFIRGELDTGFIPAEYPQGFHGVQLSAAQEDDLVAGATVMNAMRQMAVAQVSGRSPHAHVPRVLDVVVSFGRKTSSGQGAAAVVTLPRSFAVRLEVADAEDGIGAEAVAAFESAPQGDGSVWTAHITPVETGASLKPTGPTRTVRLGNVDWASDGPLLLAGRLDVATGAPASERTLRLQQVARFADGFRLQLAGAVRDVFVRTREAHALESLMRPLRLRDPSRSLVSPMPGALVSLSVVAGQEVEEGQEVAVVEAMKMQNLLRAPRKARVAKVHAKPGDTLTLDQVIVSFE